MIIFAELKIADQTIRLAGDQDPMGRLRMVIQLDAMPGVRTLTPARARILGETLLRFAEAAESDDP